jgi:hypothetical protein
MDAGKGEFEINADAFEKERERYKAELRQTLAKLEGTPAAKSPSVSPSAAGGGITPPAKTAAAPSAPDPKKSGLITAAMIGSQGGADFANGLQIPTTTATTGIGKGTVGGYEFSKRLGKGYMAFKGGVDQGIYPKPSGTDPKGNQVWEESVVAATVAKFA